MSQFVTNAMWKQIFTAELEYFESYLQLIEKTIQSDWQRLEAEDMAMREAGIKPGYDDSGVPYDPYDFLANQAYDVHRLEQLMLSSFVMTIFAFVEYRLNTICKITQNRKNIPFGYKDLKGSGIVRSIKYIDKLYGTKFLSETGLQTDLNTLIIIRNSITHNDSRLKNDYISKVNLYIKNNPGLFEVDELGKIQLERKYANFLIEFIKKIEKELESFVVKTGLHIH